MASRVGRWGSFAALRMTVKDEGAETGDADSHVASLLGMTVILVIARPQAAAIRLPLAPLCKGGCHGVSRDWGIVIRFLFGPLV